MIIAELCQNHLGDKNVLKRMVTEAARAGAWACKIQTFFADDLSPHWGHNYNHIKRCEVDWETHRHFVHWCEEAGVVPMTSVYSIQYANKLSNAGFKWVKIGSAQAADEELIRYYATLGFKVIISTGGRKLEDIKKFYPLEAVLHCVSKYPHSPYEASLERMLEIKYTWSKSAFGFSDHTDPTHQAWFLPSYLAMYLGASYIEKHFTIYQSHQTKDGPVSIDAKKLAQLVRFDKLDKKLKEHELKRLDTISALTRRADFKSRELIKDYEGRWKKFTN